MNQLTPYHTSPFDAIRQINENGQEYWSARDLQSPLGYVKWERFKDAVERAMIACKNSGHTPEDHFPDVGKGIKGGKGVDMEIQDYHLSRYACYLVAMNGDPRKPEIASAQTYFATKTREAELAQSSHQLLHARDYIDQLQQKIDYLIESNPTKIDDSDRACIAVQIYRLSHMISDTNKVIKKMKDKPASREERTLQNQLKQIERCIKKLSIAVEKGNETDEMLLDAWIEQNKMRSLPEAK